MKYGSVCSGIGGCRLALPESWECSFFAEIDAFPSAVLSYHWPNVPNIGDFTGGSNETVDLIIGGTPCQSFSIAGKRKGLDDRRGSLALEYLRLARSVGARWFIWENVPGVLSANGGRDFATFIKSIHEFGYQCAWRVLDAQFFGVPQRRRRVFVVGYLGKWRAPAAVLFESSSLQRNSKTGRKEGAKIAGTFTNGTGSRGYRLSAECAASNHLQVQSPAIGKTWKATSSQSLDSELQDFVIDNSKEAVAFALRGREGGARLELSGDKTSALRSSSGGSTRDFVFDPTQVTSKTNRSNPKPGDPVHTISKGGQAPTLAYHASQDPVSGEVSPCLSGNATIAVGVRRLTPLECERLQGLPDNHTQIPWRKKPKEECPDGLRYKAIGNGFAIPVVRWIANRVQMVENILQERKS